MLITGYSCFRSSGFLCAAGFKYDAIELSGHNLVSMCGKGTYKAVVAQLTTTTTTVRSSSCFYYTCKTTLVQKRSPTPHFPTYKITE